jgi:hypothetical protein
VLPLILPPGIRSLRTLRLLATEEGASAGGAEWFVSFGAAAFDLCKLLAAFLACFASASDSESESSELELLDSLDSLPLELELPPPPDLLLLCAGA